MIWHEFVITSDKLCPIVGLDLIKRIKSSLIFDVTTQKHCLSIPSRRNHIAALMSTILIPPRTIVNQLIHVNLKDDIDVL